MGKSLKLAVVTDDGETISAHFGRAKFFQIYTLVDGVITASERIEKVAHQHGHNHDDHAQANGNVQIQSGAAVVQQGQEEAARHADMFAPLKGCAVVLARGMGYGAHTGLNAVGVQPIITDIRLITDAIKAYTDGTIVDHPEKLH